MIIPVVHLVQWFSERLAVSASAVLVLAFSIGFLSRGSGSSSRPKMRTPTKTVDQYGYLKKRASGRAERDGFECPFEYLLNIYGKHHFAPFVKAFQPNLASEDPAKHTLILDIMDAVHFALILVDDISDDSYQRKNHPTAHLIWGASETANRAYLVLTGVINRALRDRPVLGAELMKALEDILQGQDLSLVWRRDGLRSFPLDGQERLAAYKKMAQLKTGTLFTLLGRLLNDGRADMDDKLLQFGWYAQLQNDCKNIYSSEYAKHKGAVAEDLRNGELSYPIVVALNDESGGPIMEKALETRAEADIEAAMGALQTEPVREACLKAMQDASVGVEKLVALWGRREKMQGS